MRHRRSDRRRRTRVLRRVRSRRAATLARPVARVEGELGDERLGNYNGIRIGARFVVSASVEDDDGDDERALVFAETLALEDDAPAPPGIWAGRLGRDRLVTIGRDAKEPRTAFVYLIEV